jgi:hypothetical protein
MGKKTACILLIVIAILAQALSAQDTPPGEPADGGAAARETANQETANQETVDPKQGSQEPAGEKPGERKTAESEPASGDAREGESTREPMSRNLPERKDPFVAGVFSWFMMGVGQIYCREYWKGSLFIAADLVDKVALLLLVSHVNSQYSPESGTATINWSSFDDGTKVLVITYLAVSLGLRFYSVADAVHSANDYNDRMFAQRERSGLSFSNGGKKVSLSYSIPLHD